MSLEFNGNAIQLPFDDHYVVLAAELAVNISVGDLLVFNPATNTVLPIDTTTAGINDTASNIQSHFVGVAVQTNTSTNPTTGYPSFPTEGFYGISVNTEVILSLIHI